MALSAQPETGRLDLSASTGAYRAAEFGITDASGSAVTGWTGADDPVIEVWSGDDRAALAGTGLSAKWLSDAAGTVTIESAGTHTISPASYQWRMLATYSGKTYEVCRGVYVVNPAPGEASNTPSGAVSPYTTIDDLRTLAPWVEQLQGKHDRTGFAEHQEAARAWFDDTIISAWRGGPGRIYTTPATGFPWQESVDYPPEWLTTVLASGEGVKMTPRIRRACAAYALYSICAAQMTLDGNDSAYRKKAIQFRSLAHSEITSQVIYVKSRTTATTYDIAINLGIAARN